MTHSNRTQQVSRSRRARTCGAIALVLGILGGCGDLTTGPDRAPARSEPVSIEGVTVHPPCRGESCGDPTTGANPEPSCRGRCQPPTTAGAGGGAGGSSGEGGTGKSAPTKPRNKDAETNPKCAAAVIALATAMSLERTANDLLKKEKAESERAASAYATQQRLYAPNGLTRDEAQHLAELKRDAATERQQAQVAEIDLRQKKRAVELAKAAVLLACITPV